MIDYKYNMTHTVVYESYCITHNTNVEQYSSNLKFKFNFIIKRDILNHGLFKCSRVFEYKWVWFNNSWT